MSKTHYNYFYLLISILAAGCSHPEETPSKPVVTVQVAPAQLAEVQFTVEAPATVFPKEQANISSRITAPIRELRARKGDTVAAGQVLAVLESRDLAAQRNEAAAMVTDSQASQQKMVTGTLPGDEERSRGQLATSEAALQQADKMLARRTELFRQGAIPNRDLQISQTEQAQAKTAYDVAKRSLDLLEHQSRDKDLTIAESRVAQAKAKLDFAETQIQLTQLRSPFPGTVTEQFLYPGDMAKPDAPIFTVMNLSTAIARAQVPETDASQIHIGQACAFSSGDSAKEPARGRVTVVNQAVDPARRTIEVWCEIPNTGSKLRGGQFGTATVFTGKESASVVVPLTAIQFSEGTRTGFVMVVDQKHAAHRREVEAGNTFKGKVSIHKGLAEGELVIVDGAYGLPDGTEVKYAEARK